FQVVMLSASLNFNWARPWLSVSKAGCQTSVSGKYSRRRGVDNCSGLPKDTCGHCSVTVVDIEAWLVSMLELGPAVTFTVAATAPTCRLKSSVVMFDELTGTSVMT